MTISLRSAIPALLCAAGYAGLAGAQGTPAAAAPAASACEPGASQAVAKATLFLQQAAASVNAKQDATKPLKLAITALTTPTALGSWIITLVAVIDVDPCAIFAWRTAMVEPTWI